MVGVMIIKTREQHFPFVIFIITVGVLQEDKAATCDTYTPSWAISKPIGI